MCLQSSSEAIFLEPGMGFKGSVCVFVCVGACVHSKTCLPPRRSKGPTYSYAYLAVHGLGPVLPRPPASAVELKGYMYGEIVPHQGIHFVLGRHGLRYKDRGPQT